MTNHNTRRQRLQRSGLLPARLPEPIDPALAKHVEERASNTQNRIADRITRFSGSMAFVYVHIVWFSTWIGLGVEKYPYGLLTMIVSLEAIFLSTFVMISQNRADAKHQVIVDEQWSTVKEEDRQGRELLDLSQQILDLTKAVHAYTSNAAGRTDRNDASPAGTGGGGRTGSNDAGAGSPGAALMQSSPRDSRCRRVDKVCSAPRRRPPSRKREPSHLSST